MPITLLPDRTIVEVTGADRRTFLQGLVSNDVTRAVPGQAVWSALLTPQGKWLTDFLIIAEGERLLLDLPAADAPDLVQRLGRFRLRAQVALRVEPGLSVGVAWGGAAAPEGGISAADPRLPEAGLRFLTDAAIATDATPADWDLHRLALGLPDGAPDLEREKTVLLEAGFDELNGISWTKGCYMGQELTARTRYRGLLKRRLVPVAVAGPLPAPGTPIRRGEAEVGEMRSGRGTLGLALLRLEAIGAASLTCGEARLTPRVPAWMRLPEPAAP